MLSLRINSNTPAINTHRNLVTNDMNVSRSLERVSSGLKVNRGADGPSTLVISERLRSQIAAYSQALDNNEQSIAMSQTAEAAMNEANLLLVRMKQLSIHASNEGANDPDVLEADQAEMVAAMEQLDRIARHTQYGTRELLNGSHADRGIVFGKDLEFIQGTPKTKDIIENGASVIVTQAATKAQKIGEDEFNQDVVDEGLELKVFMDGKTVEVPSQKGDTVSSMLARLNNLFSQKDIKLSASISDNQKLIIESTEWGSKPEFKVYSSVGGILSDTAGVFESVQNGLDVKGSINDEEVSGIGQYMHGREGTSVEGMVLRYNFDQNWDGDPVEAGVVHFEQNALRFQVGSDYGQTLRFKLPSVYSDDLGKEVDNQSNFASVRQIDLRTFQGAQDAILLLNKATSDISLARAELGAVQRNGLETNSRFLRSAKENMTLAESGIRDTDMAEEIATLTREQVKKQTAMAMMVHANNGPQGVLRLLQ